MVMVLYQELSPIGPDGDPLVIVMPLTFTIAWLSFVVGVTVTVVMA
jgi:hypothetical protein